MKTKKKVLKIAAVLTACLLLAGVLCVTNTITGYPVDYFVVNHALKEYMKENYGETDFVAGKPERMLKLGGFWVDVTSPSSPDTHFSLRFHCDGTLWQDSYAEDVENRGNVLWRLSQEYNTRCQELLEQSDFAASMFCNGSLLEAADENQYQGKPGTYPLPLDPSQLKLDTSYDIPTLSAKHGMLYLHVESDSPTAETAAQALLDIRQVMEDGGLPFRCVELWVCLPDAWKVTGPKNGLHILNFGWDDIHEDGMLERTAAALEATTAFFSGE